MIVDRILKIIEFKGINKSKFYSETKLSNGFLDKVKDIGSSKVEQILNTYSEINPDWLIRGKGEMLLEEENAIKNLSIENSNIKRILEIQKLDAGDQARILDALDALIRDAKSREGKK